MNHLAFRRGCVGMAVMLGLFMISPYTHLNGEWAGLLALASGVAAGLSLRS